MVPIYTEEDAADGVIARALASDSTVWIDAVCPLEGLGDDGADVVLRCFPHVDYSQCDHRRFRVRIEVAERHSETPTVVRVWLPAEEAVVTALLLDHVADAYDGCTYERFFIDASGTHFTETLAPAPRRRSESWRAAAALFEISYAIDAYRLLAGTHAVRTR